MSTSIRTLTLITAGLGRPETEELEHRERSDVSPRISFFGKELNTEFLDDTFLLRKVPRPRRFIYQFLPTSVAQVLEAFLVRNQYDAVVSWAEHLGIPFAFLLKISLSKTPHIAIFSWVSKHKKAVLLRYLRSHIDRMILMSSVQRNAALAQMSFPPEKLPLLRWSVDTKFWRPMPTETTMICSVGREMRDYGTLLLAIRDLNIPCHIAAGVFHGKKDAWIDAVEKAGPLPAHITIGRKNYTELRELYTRSRFLVMPLLETDTDNGTTSILEAMAMGKAVICSRTEGQVDVIQDGKTGLFVPINDPGSLQKAILHLWNNPAIADQIGRAGRQWVEENHSLELWVGNVRRIVGEVISEKQKTNKQ